ncbi:MAG: DNA primase [Thermodesulfobacteriota bacterium]
MAFGFSDDTVSRVRQAADIVDVVSAHVVLRQQGRKLLGLCPFHTEKTPSFSVDRDRGFFHCVGCNEGGDVFDFVMKRDGVSFPEAVRSLAARFGIEVQEKPLTPAQKKKADLRQQILAANREAAAFFASCLAGSEGAAARGYLASRGIPEKAVGEWRLGFAPASYDAMMTALQKKGFSAELVEQAGLAAVSDRGKRYSRFRNRVMFPIANIHGEIVGFGGRVMDDALPKYLNTAATPIYDKKRVLFGLDRAHARCRETGEVFVVEGYLDVIVPSILGVKNIVATCGTALSELHARAIKGAASRVTLVFDADAAGRKAAARSLPIFAAEHVPVRVMSLPEGHDPDTFVREKGAEAFYALAEKSAGILEFLTAAALQKHGDSFAGKARVVQEMAEHLAALTDPVERSLEVRALAQRLSVDEQAVLEHVRRVVGEKSPGPAGPRSCDLPAAASGPALMERTILCHLVNHPELVPIAQQSGILEHFQNEDLKAIGLMLSRGENGESLMASLSDPGLRKIAAELLSRAEPLGDCGQANFSKLAAQYERQWVARRKGLAALSKISETEKNGDTGLALSHVAHMARQSRKFLK